MGCRTWQRLTNQYFETLKRQRWTTHRLYALRIRGDAEAIAVAEVQENVAIEEAYNAWQAVNGHRCSSRCK